MIRVSLHNSGGELDSASIPENEDQDEQSHAIIEVIDTWTVSPGDTIKIETVA